MPDHRFDSNTIGPRALAGRKQGWGTLCVTVLVFLFTTGAGPALAQCGRTWDPRLAWDFQDHSHTHPNFAELTSEQIRDEMRRVDTAFLDRGYSVPSHHAYPFGSGATTSRVESVIAEYRCSGRGIGVVANPFPIPDWYSVRAYSLANSWTNVVAAIEQCITAKSLLIFYTHDVQDPPTAYGVSPARLEQLLDHLLGKQRAGLLEVVTMAEASDLLRVATKPRALVVVSFDDGLRTDYTTVYPRFRSRGLKGTSYIATSFVGKSSYLTWEMIESMRASACGNNMLDPGEQCDAGAMNSNTRPDACRADCTLPRCGDGTVDAAEACDDGNRIDGDGCSADCAVEITDTSLVANGDFSGGTKPWMFYSNGVATFSVVSGKARVAIATQGSNVQLYQHDLKLQAGTVYRLRFRGRNSGGDDVEVHLIEHRPPNVNLGLIRVFDLTPVDQEFSIEFRATASTSDGRLMFWMAPYDRPGNSYYFDDVSISGGAMLCGNGLVEAGESCDDGNASNVDGCLVDCTVARCGDGFVWSGVEACDDGNRTDGDGCSATCAVENLNSNMVANGDFSGGTTPWMFYSDSVASFAVVSGQARIAITTPGSNVQLFQYGLKLEAGALYRLRFHGRNSGGDDVEVRLIEHRPPYVNLGLLRTFDLTPTDQAFNVEFRATASTSDGRLMFWVAPYDRPGNSYYFDDVVLERVR